VSPLLATATVLAELAGGWGNVTAAYVLVIGAIVAYAVFVIVRGRRVGRQLPPEERRWM
jgi:hypothetical protein